jgi:TRAP-type C4-dicarboxylate transport system substrate-binding protein
MPMMVGLATNASAGKVTLKLGWAETADPFKKQVSAAMLVFKHYVEQQSGGEIKVNLYCHVCTQY